MKIKIDYCDRYGRTNIYCYGRSEDRDDNFTKRVDIILPGTSRLAPLPDVVGKVILIPDDSVCKKAPVYCSDSYRITEYE